MKKQAVRKNGSEKSFGRAKICWSQKTAWKQVENDSTLFYRIITSDESWFFQYNPEMKHQSQQWLSPNALRLKKAHMSKSKVKIMVICFFDSRRCFIGSLS